MTTRVAYFVRVFCKDSAEEYHSHEFWTDNIDISSCPNSTPDHTFIETTILDQISSNVSIVGDDTSNTNGIYRAKGFVFDVAPGPDTNYKVVGEYSVSYNTRIYSITATPSVNNIDDMFSFVAAKDTVVGILISGVSGGNVLNVNSTVLSNMKIGFDVSLGTGNSVGECIGIDTTAMTITVEDTISSTYPIGTPVLLTIKRLEDIYIASDKPLSFGSNTVGSSLAPAGLKGSILYKNNSASAKKFSLYVETSY